MSDHSASPRPTLARELLWNLGLLTAAALSLAIATTLFVQTLAPRPALIALVALIVANIVSALMVVQARHQHPEAAEQAAQ